jgi:hypothetical protein
MADAWWSEQPIRKTSYGEAQGTGGSAPLKRRQALRADSIPSNCLWFDSAFQLCTLPQSASNPSENWRSLAVPGWIPPQATLQDDRMRCASAKSQPRPTRTSRGLPQMHPARGLAYFTSGSGDGEQR